MQPKSFSIGASIYVSFCPRTPAESVVDIGASCKVVHTCVYMRISRRMYIYPNHYCSKRGSCNAKTYSHLCGNHSGNRPLARPGNVRDNFLQLGSSAGQCGDRQETSSHADEDEDGHEHGHEHDHEHDHEHTSGTATSFLFRGTEPGAYLGCSWGCSHDDFYSYLSEQI